MTGVKNDERCHQRHNSQPSDSDSRIVSADDSDAKTSQQFFLRTDYLVTAKQTWAQYRYST